MNNPDLNLYTPDAFVNRQAEKDTAVGGINAFRDDRSQPRSMIFTGVRCVGKTWFALHLARTIIPEMHLPHFFISLLEVQEGGQPEDGEWWPNSDIQTEEQKGVVLEILLDKIANHWAVTELKTGSLEDKSMYLQKDISSLPDWQTLVLIIDSAHESDETFFNLLQKYVITPLTHTNRVFTIITGRGSPPTWDSPYLRTADAAQVVPFSAKDVGLQLKAPNLKRRFEDSQVLADISGGYPGTVRLLVEAGKTDLYDAIPEVLEKLLSDVPPTLWKIVYEYLKRICVLRSPFRVSEIEVFFNRFSPQVLSPADVQKAQDILLDINLMEWRRGGYKLNESIKIPLQKYLQVKEPTNWSVYQNTAIELFNDLVKKYENEGYDDAVRHYQGLAQELGNIEGRES